MKWNVHKFTHNYNSGSHVPSQPLTGSGHNFTKPLVSSQDTVLSIWYCCVASVIAMLKTIPITG